MAIARSAVNPVTLGELVEWATEALTTRSESARLDAELLLSHAAGVGRSTIRAFPDRAVGVEARRAFEQLIERRRDNVPTAYLLGKREFYSLDLAVGPAVLVPRPETELVVETALVILADDAPAELLDLGTGSGAIALAIKHERPRARVMAIDSSAAALGIARGNAAALGLDVEFLKSDWFEALAGRRFDVIVANPPYVASVDLALSGALRHEPTAALDGGPDGLDALRAIIRTAAPYLLPAGTLVIEHGDAQGEASRALALENGYTQVRTLKDLAGRDRVLVASLP